MFNFFLIPVLTKYALDIGVLVAEEHNLASLLTHEDQYGPDSKTIYTQLDLQKVRYFESSTELVIILLFLFVASWDSKVRRNQMMTCVSIVFFYVLFRYTLPQLYKASQYLIFYGIECPKPFLILFNSITKAVSIFLLGSIAIKTANKALEKLKTKGEEMVDVTDELDVYYIPGSVEKVPKRKTTKKDSSYTLHYSYYGAFMIFVIASFLNTLEIASNHTLNPIQNSVDLLSDQYGFQFNKVVTKPAISGNPLPCIISSYNWNLISITELTASILSPLELSALLVSANQHVNSPSNHLRAFLFLGRFLVFAFVFNTLAKHSDRIIKYNPKSKALTLLIFSGTIVWSLSSLFDYLDAYLRDIATFDGDRCAFALNLPIWIAIHKLYSANTDAIVHTKLFGRLFCNSPPYMERLKNINEARLTFMIHSSGIE